ncbi:alpha/beta hydrolase [Pseudoalteromonas sp. S1727]|uniref:alpha/beta fold hydrolase n=1 Tax=Pseudoalteromonas sp. S1727 TaxID=2066514 RepID=UPI00110929A3|nr:alpha/beta hydrolase [Pseudoalteromonas sp. S1727]TMN73370.1 alpha/beta hydrolase [Pseudoalteromonas sp. S1727]
MHPFSVQSGELTLHGLTFGQGKEIVIGLHGWLDNCHSFLPMLENNTLSATWYCIDFPGHGKSDWRGADAHYYFIDYIDDIDDIYNLIDKLSVAKVHLVGHSMGAMAAGLFASCFAEKVKSVTMIEGLGVITTPSEEVVTQLRKAILNRHRIKQKVPRYYDSKQTLYQARAQVSDLPLDLVTVLMERNIIKGEQGWLLSTDPKLKNHSGFRFDEQQCITAISEINVPCQLILGHQGYPFVKQNLDKYGCYYKGLIVNKVVGGHHCHMQSPSECLQHVQAFMLQTGAC